MTTNGMETAETYLTVAPTYYSGYYRDGEVKQIRVVKATSKRPTSIPAGAVVLKLSVEIPQRAFLPIQPAATVMVPEGFLITGDEVVAVARDPHAETE